MLLGFLGVLYVPWLSQMFQLSWSPDVPGLVALGVGVVGAGAVSVVHAFAGHGKPDEDGPPAVPANPVGAAVGVAADHAGG
jgi:hypothetical protein